MPRRLTTKIICGKTVLEAQTMTTTNINISKYKNEIRRTLAAAEELGPQAYSVAVTLLDTDMSMAEILEAIKKVPSGRSDAVHYRGNAIRADASTAVRRAEEDWQEWEDDRTPAQITLGHQIEAIAKGATARVINGQIRFNGGDALDIGLMKAGAKKAERLLK
jgi:hypothetical protein